VRIEIADSLVPIPNIIVTSTEYLIQLDNTRPLPTPILASPTIDIHIASGGDCKDVIAGDTITGCFVARDLYFGGFSLSTEPNTAAIPSTQPTPTAHACPGALPSPLVVLSGTSQTAAHPGNKWVLNTSIAPSPGKKMKPCGYVIRLDVSDRSIVNSQPGSHNWNHMETGFCLRAKP
jgi:hypothetical protein